jgi:hypothetical protein
MRNEIKYSEELIAQSDKAYDEASIYLGQASHHTKNIRGKLCYFFDDKETKAVRTDGGRKIEISSLVEQDIIDSIKHILKSEIRESDNLE